MVVGNFVNCKLNLYFKKSLIASNWSVNQNELMQLLLNLNTITPSVIHCDFVSKIPFFLDLTVALDYFLDLQDHKVVCNNLRILPFDLLLS